MRHRILQLAKTTRGLQTARALRVTQKLATILDQRFATVLCSVLYTKPCKSSARSSNLHKSSTITRYTSTAHYLSSSLSSWRFPSSCNKLEKGWNAFASWKDRSKPRNTNHKELDFCWQRFVRVHCNEHNGNKDGQNKRDSTKTRYGLLFYQRVVLVNTCSTRRCWYSCITF